MENESLTGIIISVFSGISVILLLLFRTGIRKKGILRQFFLTVLLGNLIWYSVLFLVYARSVKPELLDFRDIFMPDFIFSSFLFILRFLFLFFFFRLTLRLFDVSLSRQVTRALKISVGLILLLWFSAWFEISSTGNRGVTDRLMIYTDIIIFACILVTSIYLFFRAPHASNSNNRRAIRKISYVFLIPFLLGLLKWIIGDSLGIISPFIERILIYAMVVLFNLLVLWWSLRYANSVTGNIAFIKHFHEEIGTTLPQKYGLTDPEMDVVKLICEGKSNKEIADILFLSVDIIKDHTHNIFMKTGVKNRAQLANLFSGGIDGRK